jgi:hypothetical protein
MKIKPCPECGEVPEIDGSYSENKKVAFCDLRLSHWCRLSPESIVIESNASTPKQWTEQQLRERLVAKWNMLCRAKRKKQNDNA